MKSTTLPEPGQIAPVRQRLYLVEVVRNEKFTADAPLLGLVCVDDDNQGAPLEVLWEKEFEPQIVGQAWDSIEALAKRGSRCAFARVVITSQKTLFDEDIGAVLIICLHFICRSYPMPHL